MDPISGLSLAASVIALIQISREAAQICADLIETGSVSQYRIAEDAATDIEMSLVALRAPLKAASGSASMQDDELLDLAGKCSSTANNLKITLNKLKKDPNGGFRDALKKTLRAMTKKKEIEQNRRDLNDYEKALNTRILVRLNASAAKTSEGYDEVRRKLADLGISIENSSQATAQKVTEQLQNSAQGINFLEDLRFPDIFSRQEQLGDAHKKTFEWIFSPSKSSGSEGKWANFTAWLEETEGPNLIYWIHGKAGAGKSTLMTYVIEDPRTYDGLRAWCGKDAELLTPSFFFWAAGSGLQRTVQGLLRSVMYQILMENGKILSELLNSSRNKRGLRPRPGLAWTERRLLGFLDEIIKITAAMGIYICFFLDGLDEYDGEIDLLKTWIFDLNTHQHVKVCVSSRPEEAFRRAFTGMPQLRLQDLTRGDIKLYIHDRLESRMSDSLEIYQSVESSSHIFTKQQLVEKMLQSADGVFLWVKLVVHDLLTGLEAGESLEQLHIRLEETPLEIRGLYAHMLKKVPKSLEPRTISYLSLMLATHIWGDNNVDSEGASGLKLLEVVCSQDDSWKRISNSDFSFGSEPSFDQICNRVESQIVFCCAGLVDIEDAVEKEMPQKHLRALNFIHRSAIEFLQTDGQWAPKTALVPAFVQLARAKIGLWSLVASDILDVYFIDPSKVALLDKSDPVLCQLRKSSSQNRVKFAVINSALMMEDYLASQDPLKELHGEDGKVINSLCTLLKKFSAKLWEDEVHVTRWQPKGIDSVIGSDAESDIPYLATFGFRRTIDHIERSSVVTASDFDRVIDYVLCSFSCGSKIILKNLVSIAHTAFERGAALERSITIQFNFFRAYDWLKDKDEGLPCRQSTWAFLIWRFIHSNSVFNDPILAQHIECVGLFLELCLARVANSNATCLIPIRENEELGYFIHEFSLSAIVRLRVQEPQKTKFLQILEKHEVKCFDQISYFVDTNLALYRLTEGQSDTITDLVRERDDVRDFYEFNWGASHGDKIDETRQLAGKRVRESLKDATFLGSLKNGVVVGDETTYEPVYQDSNAIE